VRLIFLRLRLEGMTTFMRAALTLSRMALLS
jgi:hypothetical protein